MISPFNGIEVQWDGGDWVSVEEWAMTCQTRFGRNPMLDLAYGIGMRAIREFRDAGMVGQQECGIVTGDGHAHTLYIHRAVL